MSEYTPFAGGTALNGQWAVDSGTAITALNTDDGDTNRLYAHNTGAGTATAYAGLTTPIPSGATSVKVTWKARNFVDATAGNKFRIGIYRPADGLTYYGALYEQSHLTNVFANYVETISLTSGGVSVGAGDVKFEATSNGDDSYYLITYAKVETPEHTVTVSSDSHSAFDQEGALIVADAGSLTVTATPSSGYRIQDVLVDGVSVGDATGKTSYIVALTNVTTDHTISVTAYLYINSSMTDRGERVTCVYDFSSHIEASGLSQIVGPAGGFPWSAPEIVNAGAMVRTWDGNLYAANDENAGATSNGAIYQLGTGLYDTPVKVYGLVSALSTIVGSLVQSTGVITALLPTDFRRVAVGAKITGAGITGTATVTAKNSTGDSITVTGTLTGDQTNKPYTCWGREIEARAVCAADRFDLMGDLISAKWMVVAYACPTGELFAVQHSYDLARATIVTLTLPATGAADTVTHRPPQDRATVKLPSASRTAAQIEEFAFFFYNGSAGTDVLSRGECWGGEVTARALRSYK